MALDPSALGHAVAARGRVVRVVVAATAGSAPREAGAAMLVWQDGQEGTIGGGALEFEAAARARALLGAAPARVRVDRLPLGPGLGQCCGGAVTLVSELFDAATLAGLRIEAGLALRPAGGAAEPPLAVARIVARARGEGVLPATQLVQGWLVEPVVRPRRALWIWGAGHVGRALVAVLAPLPDVALTWIDTGPARFPDDVPPGVAVRVAPDPVALVAEAPRGAEHLVLTYSHALDLALCHALLAHGFARCGLIGSATKRARFRARLAALGHEPAAVARIDCPIGDPALGKHPQAIAIGVGAALLRQPAARAREARP
jgi:xanthine dehydrogenase accessory factor